MTDSTDRRTQLRALRARRRLAFIVIIFAALYVVFDVYMFVTRGLFLFIGVDYRTFWASALIAHTHGFAQVYNLDLQKQIQEPLVYAFAAPTWDGRWATIPTPYLPAFVVPFLPFLALDPGLGWAVWTALNILATLGYMIWFWRVIGGTRERAVILAMCLSFPVIETFQFGQVNGWLMIFMGEFFRHSLVGNDLRAGLWLAGLLLKPQTLMVIGPGLLIARRWRVIGGAAIGGMAIATISLLAAGIDGVRANLNLIFLYSGNVASTVPTDMMNWRSLAIHLSRAIPGEIAWGLSMVGLVVTYAAGLSVWFKLRPDSSTRFAVVILGSYAATCAVAWHSHTHMGLPMVIPLLYLASQRQIPYRALAVWLLTPYLVFAILRVVFDLGHVGVLAANLYLLGWAFQQLRQSPTPTPEDAPARGVAATTP